MKIDEKILERDFKALANRRRLAILRLLKRQKCAAVGEIAGDIKLSFKATSKHLNILCVAGLVDKEQQSLGVQYFLKDGLREPLRTVINSL